MLIERGLVRALHRGRGAIARAARQVGVRSVDLGEVALAPGLVNAHAHLELSFCAGRLTPGGSFPRWIAALLEQRRSTAVPEMERALRAGADRLLASGTTTVGDIDGSGLAERVLAGHPMRSVVYREALDLGQPERRRAVLAKLARALPRRRRRLEGLSPHAPYTVSTELLHALGAIARRRELPISMHWAETPEEREWLELGTGPFADLLAPGPRIDALEALRAAGPLGPHRARALSLVHGNEARPDELERVARAGALLVHCPGTHLFFGRPRFALERAQRAGLRVALGTDSLASNADLDLRREMALLRRSHPSLAPAQVWSMATRESAAALGLEGVVGELRPGARADLCAWSGRWRSAGDCLEDLTTAALAPTRIWIGGREWRPPSVEGDVA